MRKTKIVCTIGPASESIEKLDTINGSRYERCSLKFFTWKS